MVPAFRARGKMSRQENRVKTVDATLASSIAIKI